LNIKQTCESDRMEDTRRAIAGARASDEDTETIERLSEEIAELAAVIKAIEAGEAKARASLKKATQLRKEANAAWVETDADDKKAAETVASATAVLVKFYKDNKVALVQRAAIPDNKNGAAPPPPPQTFGGAYGGKQEESAGIISLLTTVQDDILKDQALAKTEEGQSVKEFESFKFDTNDHLKALGSSKNKKNGSKSTKEEERSDVTKSRKTKNDSVAATMGEIAATNPNCEYYEVNYPVRRNNRQIELDGLWTAKAVMSGGEFTKPADPNREIKPGDAFLQRRN